MTVLIFLVLAGVVWWASGYLFAYTDDAYLTSDAVSVAPEVSGPIEAIHVTDNAWVKRGAPLFTIDPVPFRLAVEQARAEEARSDARLPIDEAEVAALQAQEESADAAARLAASNLRREAPLGQSGAISGEALDRTNAMKEQQNAQLMAARAAITKAMETARFDKAAVGVAHAARLRAWACSRCHG